MGNNNNNNNNGNIRSIDNGFNSGMMSCDNFVNFNNYSNVSNNDGSSTFNNGFSNTTSINHFSNNAPFGSNVNAVETNADKMSGAAQQAAVANEDKLQDVSSTLMNYSRIADAVSSHADDFGYNSTNLDPQTLPQVTYNTLQFHQNQQS